MLIGVLGPLTVCGDTASVTPRDRVVLAALVVGRGDVVRAESLAEALWPGQEPPPSWAKVIQGCVVRIRKVLGPAAVGTGGNGYRLAVAPDEVDANRFERLLGRARELLTLGEPDRAVFTVDEALSLWRGRPLAELDEWEPGRIEATRLDELRLDAEELRIDAALRAGRYREVLADAQARVAQAPLREHRWTLLALAMHQAGRQGDALRTLHEARQVLVRELGLDPGEELVALEAAILRQDPSLVAARLPTPSAVCPYRGLTAYDVADADTFFGREAAVAECLRRLRVTGVLAVVGPSGSGKSSLLRAGLAPALQRDGNRVVVVTPGAHPMDALAPLARSGPPTVLVVDQFEEALTVCTDPEERTRFFDAVTEHATTAGVVLGLRADRLGELSAHPSLAGLVERGLHLLTPMDPDELRQAIEAPARQAGLLLEAGLVDLLVRDVEGEPGSLPLLSHALYQTWERREANTLTVAGYRASGGIRGAVAQSAEQVYAHVPPERRQMLRDLMLRLVAPSAEGEPVRLRVPRRVAAPDADREQLLDALVEARLVTSDVGSVELAHEALARAWPRLREWLDDDVEGIRTWRHLTGAADTWEAMGRPDSELYRGVRLARAVEWRQRASPDLDATEREFLDASTVLARVEENAAHEQARRQARSNRRLKVLAGSVAALAVAASTMGFAAARQADRADLAAELARAHELAASAIGVLDDDPQLAKLLAVVAAGDDDPTLAAQAALHEAFAADASVARWGFTGEVGMLSADVDPAGERLAAAGLFQEDGAGWTLEVADLTTGERLWAFDLFAAREPSAFLVEPRFTPDGEQVVAGVYWDPDSWRRIPVPVDGVDEPVADLLGAHLWDAGTGQLVERVDLGRCGGVVAGISDTHVLAKTLHGAPDVLTECRWRDGTIGVELIDRRTLEREVLTTATLTPWWHLGAAMSDDGQVIAFDDGDVGEVVVLDVATGAELLRLPGIGVRDLDPDGSHVLVGIQPLEVWDVAAGRPVTTLDGVGRASLDARFGPSGASVLASADDGSLREWDAATGDELRAYPELGSGPISVNQRGVVAVSNADQQVVTVVDTRRRGELGSATTCAGPAVDDTLVVAGDLAVVRAACVGDSTASTFVTDLATGRELWSDSAREFAALAVSPDGSTLADQQLLPGPDDSFVRGPLALHDVRTGELVVELERPEGAGDWPYVARVRWSPDGRSIAAALGTRLAVWDADTGALRHEADTASDDVVVVDVLFTPDSAALVSTTSDRRISHRRLDAWDDARVRTTTIDGAYRIGLVGFVDGGASLLAVGGFQSNAASALVWFDAETFDQRRLLPNVHEGSVTSVALSADATLLATASSDGAVRVWDGVTGEVVHDAGSARSAVRGVAFRGDRRLVVAPDDGGLETITIDADELVDITRASLTRGFTQSECERFGMSDECPVLAEMRGPVGDDVGSLEGTFRVAWTPETLTAAAVEDWTRSFGVAPPPGFRVDFAEDTAGAYRLQLTERRFDLFKDGVEEPVCAGSQRFHDERLFLLGERGACYPATFLEGDVTVTDDGLVIDRDGIRAEYPMALIFGSRPLERVG